MRLLLDRVAAAESRADMLEETLKRLIGLILAQNTEKNGDKLKWIGNPDLHIITNNAMTIVARLAAKRAQQKP